VTTTRTKTINSLFTRNVIDNIPLIDLIYNRLLLSKLSFTNKLFQLGFTNENKKKKHIAKKEKAKERPKEKAKERKHIAKKK
jgi:hypothetical protein